MVAVRCFISTTTRRAGSSARAAVLPFQSWRTTTRSFPSAITFFEDTARSGKRHTHFQKHTYSHPHTNTRMCLYSHTTKFLHGSSSMLYAAGCRGAKCAADFGYKFCCYIDLLCSMFSTVEKNAISRMVNMKYALPHPPRRLQPNTRNCNCVRILQGVFPVYG